MWLYTALGLGTDLVTKRSRNGIQRIELKKETLVGEVKRENPRRKESCKRCTDSIQRLGSEHVESE